MSSKIRIPLIIGIIAVAAIVGYLIYQNTEKVVPLQPLSSMCYVKVLRPNNSGGCTEQLVPVNCPPKMHHVTTNGMKFYGDGNDGEGEVGPQNEGQGCIHLDDKNEVHLSGTYYVKVDGNFWKSADYLIPPIIGGTSPFSIPNDSLSPLSLIIKIFDDNNNEVIPAPDKVAVDRIWFNSTESAYESQGLVINNFNTYTIRDEHYTYICDPDDPPNGSPICAAVINISISFTAQAGKNYHFVVFVKEHPTSSHNHFAQPSANIFCLCPQSAVNPAQVEYVENHISVLDREKVPIEREIQKEINIFLDNANQQNKRNTEPGGYDQNSLKNSGSSCCPVDMSSLYWYQCVDESSCHYANHTVVLDLPPICN